MVHGVSRWIGILMAVLAASTQAAQAQDAGEIVRHAAAAMQRAVETTQENIQEAAARGVRAINYLDDNGASDRQLITAADRARDAVNAKARRGAGQVNMIAHRAADALRTIDADPRFFVVLNDARTRALDAIDQARHRGVHAIQTALQEALDD